MIGMLPKARNLYHRPYGKRVHVIFGDSIGATVVGAKQPRYVIFVTKMTEATCAILWGCVWQ